MANSAVVGILRALLVADTAQFDKAMAGADTATKRLARTMKEDLEPSQTRINKLVRDFSGTQAVGMAKNYAEAIERVGGAANLTAEHQAKANAAIQKAIAHYKAAGTEVPPAMLALEKATRKAEVTTKDLGTTFQNAASQFKMLAGAFGVSLGVGALLSFGKSIFDTAGQIVDLSAKTGLSIKAVQLYGAVAKQTGGDISTYADAIFKLGINIAKGGKEVDAALEQLGLNVKEIKAAAPEDQMERIAEKLKAIQNDGERNRLGVLLYGKTWKDVAAGVVQGIEDIKKTTDIASDANVRAADRAADAWDQFLTNTKNKSVQLLGGVILMFDEMERRRKEGTPTVPAGAGLTGLSLFQAFVAPPPSKNLGKDINLPLQVGTEGAKDYSAALAAARKELAGLSADTKKQIKSGLDMGDSVKEVADKLKVSEAAVKLYSDALKGMGDATRKAEAEVQRHREAVEKLTGVKLHKDLEQFTKDFTAAMKAGGIGKAELEPTIKAIEGFILAGERIDPAMMTWFADASVNRILGNNAALQKSLMKTAITVQQLDMQARLSALPIAKNTPWAALLGGAIPAATLAGQANKSDLTTLGDVVKKQLGNAALAFPDMLVKAILHGQGLKRAFSAFAAQFGTEFGAAALQKLSKGMTAQQANLGLGFATFGVSLVLDDIQQSAADAEAYRQKLAALKQEAKEFGVSYQELINLQKANLDAGELIWGNKPETLLQHLKDASGLIDKLKGSLEAFGGVVPKSLNPMIEKLLQINGLPDVLKKQLESLMGQPSWRALQDQAEAFGVDPNALGPGFNQSKVKDLGLEYVRFLTSVTENGADADGVLRGMSDEISALLVQAQKTGAALPKTLEPFIKRLAEMGLLIDENGNAIDAGAFSFQDFEDEALEAMKDLLTEIKDILAKAFPAAADAAAKAITKIGDAARGFPKMPTTEDPDGSYRLPDLSNKTFQWPGLESSFDGAYVADAGGMMTVVVEADGRQMARMVTPFIPGEVRRLGLARG